MNTMINQAVNQNLICEQLIVSRADNDIQCWWNFFFIVMIIKKGKRDSGQDQIFI